MKKNEKIQILRGLAIIAVVIIHTYPDTGVFSIILRTIVNFAVPMFIFLSGYLTKLENDDYKGFCLKRVKRVFIPYCIWSVICMIPKRFENFLFDFLTWRCCGIYYYICVYIQFVLLTPFIVKLIKSKYRFIGWLITPLSTILLLYIPNIFNIPFNLEFNYIFLAWFIYYYLGIILGNNVISLDIKRYKSILLYVVTAIVSVIEGYIWFKTGNGVMAGTQMKLTTMLVSISFMILAYQYIKSEKEVKSNFISRTLVVLGDASFGIYLSHILILNLLAFIPGFGRGIFPLNTIAILALNTICVLIGKKILSKKSWILGL